MFGARPGHLVEDISIDLVRPRELKIKREPHFLQYVDRIWQLIENESAKQGFA